MPSSAIAPNALMQGLSAAFINGAEIASDADCRPQLLYNDPDSGTKVLSVLEDELKHCGSFKISVAFINDAGIAPLLLTLKELEKKGVHGQILTTDYLAFTEPKALRRLKQLSNIELKLFCCRGRDGFHTKGYIFEAPEMLHLIVGSSNWTASALATNREWNALLISKASGLFACQLLAEFDALWNRPESKVLTDSDISQYEARWQAARRALATAPAVAAGKPEKLVPNAMQQDFIQNLEALRNTGAKRALLISATGTGKTYAAAFATQAMAPQRFLFLVHREQIAQQAQKSFERVLGSNHTYGLLSGSQKDTASDCLFATMQTMAKADVLQQFDPAAFDLIIVDEVHRAGAKSYKAIMEHFQPAFWLGMTATPERTDAFDIYKLFDHNIACEIRLQTALAEDLLCPFHYFGISDLSADGKLRNKSDEFRRLTSEDRVRHLLDRLQYFGYSGDRVKGLIFCSRQDECQTLSDAFNRHGLRTIALTSGDSPTHRAAAVSRLVSDDNDEKALDYIFSVDIFNEGVDVPEINQVVMLRPTQSAIVFVQQLGRGLRKSPGKEYVVVLDFIGNYDENFLIPVALSGDLSYDKDQLRRYVAVDHRQTPGLSTVHFDEITTERICNAIDTANTQALRLLKGAYQTLKYKLGRRPQLEDFAAHNSIDATKFFEKCGSYYTFLKRYDKEFTDRLPPEAEAVIDSLSDRFGRGIRLSDALMIDCLLDNEHCILERLKKELSLAYDCPADDISVGNVAAVFSNEFYRGAGPDVPLIQSNGDGDWRTSVDFASLLDRCPLLQDFLRDLAHFMKRRWHERYSKRYQNTDFTLYGKYTYQDVCRLLNWSKDETATIGGYRFDKGTKTLPVFINYCKTGHAVRYIDRFESPQDLIAHSKAQRSTNSIDAKHIYRQLPEDEGSRIFLFVRRNKNDYPKTFYFLGEINAVGAPVSMPLDNGQPAFEIHYQLETPVRQDIYDYITKTTL